MYLMLAQHIDIHIYTVYGNIPPGDIIKFSVILNYGNGLGFVSIYDI